MKKGTLKRYAADDVEKPKKAPAIVAPEAAPSHPAKTPLLEALNKPKAAPTPKPKDLPKPVPEASEANVEAPSPTPSATSPHAKSYAQKLHAALGHQAGPKLDAIIQRLSQQSQSDPAAARKLKAAQMMREHVPESTDDFIARSQKRLAESRLDTQRILAESGKSRERMEAGLKAIGTKANDVTPLLSPREDSQVEKPGEPQNGVQEPIDPPAIHQLDSFLRKPSGASNRWIGDGNIKAYVRKGQNVQTHKGMEKALTIASVEVPEEKHDQGIWKKFLDDAHKNNPYDVTFIEQVHNDGLADFLERNHWHRSRAPGERSYYKSVDDPALTSSKHGASPRAKMFKELNSGKAYEDMDFGLEPPKTHSDFELAIPQKQAYQFALTSLQNDNHPLSDKQANARAIQSLKLQGNTPEGLIEWAWNNLNHEQFGKIASPTVSAADNDFGDDDDDESLSDIAPHADQSRTTTPNAALAGSGVKQPLANTPSKLHPIAHEIAKQATASIVNSGIDPKFHKPYIANLSRTLQSMPEAALKAVHSHGANFSFHESPEAIRSSIESGKFGKSAARWAERLLGGSIGGVVITDGDKTHVVLDGGSDLHDSPNPDPEQHLQHKGVEYNAHELTHLVDRMLDQPYGPEDRKELWRQEDIALKEEREAIGRPDFLEKHKAAVRARETLQSMGQPKLHSQTAEWQDVHDAEIASGQLTDYAKKSYMEGFAEFGRLLYSGQYDLGKVKAQYPQAFDYFARNGLIDDVEAVAGGVESPEVFEKKVVLNRRGDHADIAKAMDEAGVQPMTEQGEVEQHDLLPMSRTDEEMAKRQVEKAAQPHHQKILKMVKNAAGDPDHFRAASAAIGRMPPAATKHLEDGMKAIRFTQSPSDIVPTLLSNATPSEQYELNNRYQGKTIGGVYAHSFEGKPGHTMVIADGDYRGIPASEVHAHEFTHAIDGPSKKFSASPEWKNAWHAEIMNKQANHLSDYARDNPSDGFAEFGRLVYGQGANRKTLREKWPAATRFWEKNGLLPPEKGLLTKKYQPLAEVFDEAINTSIGHADILRETNAR